MAPVLQTDAPTCSSILPCLEWICQPARLSLYHAFIFLSSHWFIYPWFNCQGMRSAASLDDDIELPRSTLNLSVVWNVTSSWFYLGDIAWTPCLCCLRRAGWLLPAPLPLMHAHVHSLLSHTAGSRILRMKIIGSELPFFVCLCLIWVPQSSVCPFPMYGSTTLPEPSSRCLPAHLPSQPLLSGTGDSSPTAWLP